MEFQHTNTGNVFQRYKKWVIDKPLAAAEMEAIVKFGSYFLSGRLSSSTVICEIVYAGSRLFEMFNDYLVTGSMPKISDKDGNKIKMFLTIIEYVDVLIEVTAIQLWGEIGRWIVVTIIQLTKAIGRFFLLINYRVKLISSPPIKPLDRRAIAKSKKELAIGIVPGGPSNSSTMRLPRSGRVMRTLAGAPPCFKRTFDLPLLLDDNENDILKSRQFSIRTLTAEVFHILRPIGHLGSLYLFGMKSWIPYFLSFGMDITSLQLHKISPSNTADRMELSKRNLALLYYLVRSPAFNQVTQKHINSFLLSVGNKVPLARYVCQPLLQYIPEWQKIYAYTWS